MAEFLEAAGGEDFGEDKLPDFAPVRAVTEKSEAGVVVAEVLAGGGLRSAGECLVVGCEALFEEFSVADDDGAVHAEPEREDPAVLVGYGGQDSCEWDLGGEYVEVADDWPGPRDFRRRISKSPSKVIVDHRKHDVNEILMIIPRRRRPLPPRVDVLVYPPLKNGVQFFHNPPHILNHTALKLHPPDDPERKSISEHELPVKAGLHLRHAEMLEFLELLPRQQLRHGELPHFPPVRAVGVEAEHSVVVAQVFPDGEIRAGRHDFVVGGEAVLHGFPAANHQDPVHPEAEGENGAVFIGHRRQFPAERDISAAE
nr:hypothetical protein MIMGU_mgv1a009963mg [Ipomoea batatas]